MFSKRFALAALAAAMVAPAGVAYSMASGGAGQALSTAHVYGGGQLGPGTFSGGSFTYQHAHDFSVDAHKVGTKVMGHLTYGINETGVLTLSGDVRCLAVRGGHAAVGGVIQDATDPGRIGYGYVIVLTDNGSPASATRDQSSPAFVDPLSAATWPQGFPYVCPDPDGPFNAVGYLDVHGGDVVVES